MAAKLLEAQPAGAHTETCLASGWLYKQGWWNTAFKRPPPPPTHRRRLHCSCRCRRRRRLLLLLLLLLFLLLLLLLLFLLLTPLLPPSLHLVVDTTGSRTTAGDGWCY